MFFVQTFSLCTLRLKWVQYVGELTIQSVTNTTSTSTLQRNPLSTTFRNQFKILSHNIKSLEVKFAVKKCWKCSCIRLWLCVEIYVNVTLPIRLSELYIHLTDTLWMWPPFLCRKIRLWKHNAEKHWLMSKNSFSGILFQNVLYKSSNSLSSQNQF